MADSNSRLLGTGVAGAPRILRRSLLDASLHGIVLPWRVLAAVSSDQEQLPSLRPGLRSSARVEYVHRASSGQSPRGECARCDANRGIANPDGPQRSRLYQPTGNAWQRCAMSIAVPGHREGCGERCRRCAWQPQNNSARAAWRTSSCSVATAAR